MPPAKPKPGDSLWWRGMRMKITAVENGKVFHESVADNGRFRCASELAAFKWDEDYGFWFMPNVVGDRPVIVGGRMKDPEPPRCPTCNCITFRRGECTNCRMGIPVKVSQDRIAALKARQKTKPKRR